MREEVLIVGAGPTGLVLALWLTRQGVKVRIVDRSAGPGTTSRAMAVQARTLELYRQLDLSEAVVQAGYRNPAASLWVGGERRATLPFTDVGKSLTPYPFVLVYPQDRHEKLLEQRLRSRGVNVERQTEYLGFEDRGDHVLASLRGADGVERSCEAAYLAGCDGASSLIRHQIGSGFPGGTYEKIFYVADVEASGPGADGQIQIALDQSDFVAWLAYGDTGRGRLIGVAAEHQKEGGAALAFDDVGHRALSHMGLNVAKVNWFSTYRVHHRVTDRYRKGRVFLVGDAAHVHSPAGGQGMNTGIGDAINLAWKLAAALKRQAPDSLLQSYETERRSFALRLVETTDRVFSFATADGSFANFLRLKIVPILAPAAYRIGAVRETMFRILSQTMIDYRDSPLSRGAAGAVRGGDRLPWVKTASGDNYLSLAQMDWQVHVYGSATAALADWCARRGIALHAFEWTPAHGDAGLARDAGYLLRPDTYVACAVSSGAPDGFERYFSETGL